MCWRGWMALTLKEIESRLLTVMPLESTIDRPLHALAVASVIFEARRHAARLREEEIAEICLRAAMTDEFTKLVDDVEAGRENSQQEHER